MAPDSPGGAEHQEEEEIVKTLCAFSSNEARLPDIVDDGQDEELKKSRVPKVSGGYLSITYNTWKPMYVDEYTGERLPHDHLRDAMHDELAYFNEHVWEIVPIEQAMRHRGSKLIGTRWALCNKCDALNPDVRARLVAREINLFHEETLRGGHSAA